MKIDRNITLSITIKPSLKLGICTVISKLFKDNTHHLISVKNVPVVMLGLKRDLTGKPTAYISDIGVLI